MTPRCTAVGEDQCSEEHTLSECRVEVTGLVPEVGGSKFLVLAYQTTSHNPRDSDIGLFCNENLGIFLLN